MVGSSGWFCGWGVSEALAKGRKVGAWEVVFEREKKKTLKNPRTREVLSETDDDTVNVMSTYRTDTLEVCSRQEVP